MYLTRAKLDIRKRKTILALYAPTKFHGTIELLFDKKQERNLWRIDTLNNQTYLLLLSAEKPDMTSFMDQFGMDNEKALTKSYDPLIDRVTKDSIWHFRLVANPTHKIKTDNGKDKIAAHITNEYQLDWLKSKAKSNGFEIVDDMCGVMSSEWKTFDKYGTTKKSGHHKVSLLQVAFEGVLKVTDPAKMKMALINGIGRGKAYGSGMLTIASL